MDVNKTCDEIIIEKLENRLPGNDLLLLLLTGRTLFDIQKPDMVSIGYKIVNDDNTIQHDKIYSYEGELFTKEKFTKYIVEYKLLQEKKGLTVHGEDLTDDDINLIFNNTDEELNAISIFNNILYNLLIKTDNHYLFDMFSDMFNLDDNTNIPVYDNKLYIPEKIKFNNLMTLSVYEYCSIFHIDNKTNNRLNYARKISDIATSDDMMSIYSSLIPCIPHYLRPVIAENFDPIKVKNLLDLKLKDFARFNILYLSFDNIYNDIDCIITYFKEYYVKKLKCIKLYYDNVQFLIEQYSVEKCDSIMDNLNRIFEIVDVEMLDIHFNQNFDINRLRNIKSITLNGIDRFDNYTNIDYQINIPELEELILNDISKYGLSPEMKNLKTLVINCYDNLVDNDYNELINYQLPPIENLIINSCDLSLIPSNLLTNFKVLKTLKIMGEENELYNTGDLSDLYVKFWECPIELEKVTLINCKLNYKFEDLLLSSKYINDLSLSGKGEFKNIIFEVSVG
jgi:hypothetical protein